MITDIMNNITTGIIEIHLRARSCGNFGEIAFNSLTFSKPIKPKIVKIPDSSAVISEKNSSAFSLENVHRNPAKAPVRESDRQYYLDKDHHHILTLSAVQPPSQIPFQSLPAASLSSG